ncbi:MAG: HEAT repeat domain-containing protein [Bradymonadia bacterium]
MSALLRALFGHPVRALLTVLVANAAFFVLARLIHGYILADCDSAGVALGLVVIWMMTGVLTALATVTGLGDILFYRGFGARLGEEGLDPTDQDEEQLPLPDVSGRFWLIFLACAGALVMLSNRLSGNFLTQFQRPGYAVIMMRSDDPADRRKGLVNLTEHLDISVTPAVAEVVVKALADPDEGVAARAAFVAGELRIPQTAEALAQMAKTRRPLTYFALISLGRLGPEAGRDAAMGLIHDEVVRAEPQALALMIGAKRLPAIERLRQIYEDAADDDVRLAVVWALGELKEGKLVDFMAQALEHPSLAVRCAAAEALEKMTVYSAAAPLMKAFEAVGQGESTEGPETMCPKIKIPVQQGGQAPVMVRGFNYQLTLARAMSTTDDPALIPWLVNHQEGVAYKTHVFMKKMYEALLEKKKDGRLTSQMQLMQMRRLAAQQAADAGAAPPATDAGTPSSADAGTPPPN